MLHCAPQIYHPVCPVQFALGSVHMTHASNTIIIIILSRTSLESHEKKLYPALHFIIFYS